ncbi:MAG: hypothetical protein ABL929_05705 [Ferruginibacter sp.]|nr:hypothetical protein [Ferruginibacter sp.]
MKKYLLQVLLICIMQISYAQVPNQFNYQAVARNSLGQGIPNANIRTRFTILDGSATGANVYSEVRQLTTNQLGLFTAAIGGTGATSVTGNFATIDWSTGKKFIKVEVDPLGGTNFLALGNTEMLSVPYALYAVNGKVGPQGPPNVLSIGTVVTGATGTPASATIAGTSPTQTINLVLPTGANGKISLVKATAEAAGVNCTVGGTKIEAGVDNNSNNTLDAAEVTNISYVCNGDVNNTWKTTGNAASATDFIGTTNNNPFTIKTNNADAIKILPNGNVGIGNTNPNRKLSLTSDGIGFSQQNSPLDPAIGFYTSSVSAFLQTHNNFPLSFATNNGIASMRIETNGNVGIGGTGLPDATLFVRRGSINTNGSAHFQGSVYPSTFQQGANEDTYIRGGKAGSRVYINDVANTTTQIGWPALLTLSSSLRVNGSVSYSTKYVNDNYTLTDNDHILYCDMENDGSRTINVNLPTPTAAREGRVYTILVLNAPKVTPGTPSTGRCVNIIGTFGDKPIANPLQPDGYDYTHKLFYVEYIALTFTDYRWSRTAVSYICVSGQWLKLSDNEQFDSDDV